MNYRFPMNTTDQYPPFTLKARADYPGDLQVDYPEQLSRGAVLVKWWLLALPQIIMCWAMEPLLQVLCVISAVRLLVQRHGLASHVRLSDGHGAVALSRGRVRVADERRVSTVSDGSGGAV